MESYVRVAAILILVLACTVHAQGSADPAGSTTATPPTTSNPPVGSTTGTPASGPETAFGPKNLLALRYRSHFPPVVHVHQSDGNGQWTAFTGQGRIHMVSGILGRPFMVFKPSADQLQRAATLTSSFTIDNKIELARLFISVAEKPFGAMPPGEWLPQPRLTPVEKRLLDLSGLSKKIRWLFHKVDCAQSQAEKLFWGLQIRVLAMANDAITSRLLTDVWEEVDGELDRGQIAIVPGRNFDLTANAVLVHAMYRDDDTTAFGRLVESLKKRLLGELSSLDDYPPAQAAIRKKAIEKRLGVVEALLEILLNG